MVSDRGSVAQPRRIRERPTISAPAEVSMSKREHASGRRGEQAIEAFGAPARRLQRSAQRGAKPIGAPVVPKTLTAKQRRFIEEYCTDLNATGAAVRAGYSRRSASDIGYKNLRKVEIAQAITDWKQTVKIEGSLDLVARTAKIAEDVRRMTDEELREYDALERQQEALLARAHARHQAPALPAYLAGQRPAPELPDRVDSPVTIERRDG